MSSDGCDRRELLAERRRLLDAIRDRIDDAEKLAVRFRELLKLADAEAIDRLTGRAETVLAECKVLAEELGRLPAISTLEQHDPDWMLSVGRFENAALRLARRSAVDGGILRGLVEMSNRLISIFTDADGEAYLPNGRSKQGTSEGMRLRELA